MKKSILLALSLFLAVPALRAEEVKTTPTENGTTISFNVHKPSQKTMDVSLGVVNAAMSVWAFQSGRNTVHRPSRDFCRFATIFFGAAAVLRFGGAIAD